MFAAIHSVGFVQEESFFKALEVLVRICDFINVLFLLAGLFKICVVRLAKIVDSSAFLLCQYFFKQDEELQSFCFELAAVYLSCSKAVVK